MQATRSTDLHFSPDRWWGAMNYFLSVIPFLACLSAGVIQDVPFFVYIRYAPNDTDLFCTSIESCTTKHPELMAKWKNFFIQLQNGRGTARQPRDISPEHDKLVGYLWEGHTTSISVGKVPPV